MKTLKVTITIFKNGPRQYACSCDYPFSHFDLGGSGSTVEEAKQDCFTFYNEMKTEHPEDNFPDLEVSWTYDFPSFFNRFDFLNISKIAKYAGLRPSSFQPYLKGSKGVSQKQFSKIKQALTKMADEIRESALTM
jgi:hypothetical protein